MVYDTKIKFQNKNQLRKKNEKEEEEEELLIIRFGTIYFQYWTVKDLQRHQHGASVPKFFPILQSSITTSNIIISSSRPGRHQYVINHISSVSNENKTKKNLEL